MAIRAETLFLLSCLDKSTLAEFPVELDPCVDEALGIPEIHTLTVAITPATTGIELRILTVQTREGVAEKILSVTVPLAKASSDTTPIPGIYIPKKETGLPAMPIPIAMELPELVIEGSHTLEFQELIPGIKLPSIPLLLPGMEKLPLLPGWTIRDQNGIVVGEGIRIPTLSKGLPGIPIPPPLPAEALSPHTTMQAYQDAYRAYKPYQPDQQVVQPNYYGHDDVDVLESLILEETEGVVDSLYSLESDEELELGSMEYECESVLVPDGILGLDEELEL